MKKLAEKKYWDSVYDRIAKRDPVTVSAGIRAKIKHVTRDYSYSHMWEVIFRRYLPANPQWKAIEIGCAPGKHILGMSRILGYRPFGVEYSEKGCRITERNFIMAGFLEENVMQADVFDPDFQTAQKGKYDVVLSLGFIEHFDDISKVVADHANLLRRGGYMVVLIPNLRGVNYWLSRFFNKDSLAIHNLSVMDKNAFAELFSESGFERMYLDYVGIFSFGLFNTNRKWKYWLHRILLLVQRPFDLVLRLVGGAII